MIRRGSWIDAPSEGIPYLYFITGIDLVAALRAVHDSSSDAHTVFTTMAGVAHMIRYDREVPPESRGPQYARGTIGERFESREGGGYDAREEIHAEKESAAESIVVAG